MPRHRQHGASDEDVARVIGGAADDGVGPGPVNRTPSRRSAVLRAIGLIGVVVVWLIIAGLGGPAIGSLSTVQSNDQESFLPSGAESVAATEAARAFDDSGQLPAFVICSTSAGRQPPNNWRHGAPTPSRWPGSRSPAVGTATSGRSATIWSPARRDRPRRSRRSR
jgi:hypothetical protein